MPETEEPVVIIPIGYPSPAEARPRTRKSSQEIFFEE
jgi:nitroreductase